MLNTVVVPERLAVRVSAYEQQPGVIDNVRLGLKDVDASRVQGVRLSALWEPGSPFSALVSATHQTSHRDDISAWNDTAGPRKTVHAGRARFDGEHRPGLGHPEVARRGGGPDGRVVLVPAGD
ncbi:hypothetical protein ACRAWD_18415 [Caulobacter segnis]